MDTEILQRLGWKKFTKMKDVLKVTLDKSVRDKSTVLPTRQYTSETLVCAKKE